MPLRRQIRGGNPAGVVLDADHLSTSDMQKIASRAGLSETAFVQKSDKSDFKVSFFTPNEEVNLCGHATIATFYLLSNKGIIKSGIYTQETKAGVLKVECSNNMIYMEQCSPEFNEILDREEIAKTLNIGEKEISTNLPIQKVSTGLRDILVPIKSLSILNNIDRDFNKILDFSRKQNSVGYHLFTLETRNDSIAHCRNFSPLYDIPEEAATGTSTGALSCYLYKYGIISEEEAKNLVFDQGYSMNRPSKILSNLTIENEEIKKVKVGGTALNIEEKIIKI